SADRHGPCRFHGRERRQAEGGRRGTRGRQSGAQPDPRGQGQGKRRAARSAQTAMPDRRLFPLRPRLHHDRGARQALSRDQRPGCASALANTAETAQLSPMTPGARLSAAIEVLADIETRRRPAADALKDWGLTHRFAGSGDRAAIAGLVYDALRRKASAAFLLDTETPRALVLGMLRLERGLDLE